MKKTAALQLVESKRGKQMLETTARYDIHLHGRVVGQLSFNMKGYIGYLPLPNGNPLDCGEGGISRFKREVAKLNREWEKVGEINYFKITLNRDDIQWEDLRKARSEVTFSDTTATAPDKDGNFIGISCDDVVEMAVKAGKLEEELRPRVLDVDVLQEADYWRRRLCQP